MAGRQKGRKAGWRCRLAALLPFCLAALLPFGLSGCARLRAKSVPDNPPLEVPAAPARDVEPPEPDAPPPPANPAPQEPARPPAPRPRPSPPARETSRPEPPKPEPQKPPDEPARPPSTLQTSPSAAEVELERGVRATLTRATADLDRLGYRTLSADGRTQYDLARSLIRQADAAVRARNLVFAKNLADKAATLAAQLGGK